MVFDTPIFAQPETTPGAGAKDPQLLRELREKLAKILAMIGSSQPGEVANAVRLTEAIRKEHGLQWGDLLRYRSPSSRAFRGSRCLTAVTEP